MPEPQVSLKLQTLTILSKTGNYLRIIKGNNKCYHPNLNAADANEIIRNTTKIWKIKW
jgi:hypothetical protein